MPSENRVLCDCLGNVFDKYSRRWSNYLKASEQKKLDRARTQRSQKPAKTIKKACQSRLTPARALESKIATATVTALNNAIHRHSTKPTAEPAAIATNAEPVGKAPEKPPSFKRRGFSRK